MTAHQLPLRLVQCRPSAARQHIERAGIIARQIPNIKHQAGKRYAVRLLLAQLRRALEIGRGR